jgi:hypothetical protein
MSVFPRPRARAPCEHRRLSWSRRSSGTAQCARLAFGRASQAIGSAGVRLDAAAGMSPATSRSRSDWFAASRRPIGDGSFGCQRTRSAGSGHRNGNSTTAPAIGASRSVSSVARSTARCVTASPGCPSGRPKGNSIAATRGAPTAAVSAGAIESAMVLIPAASASRCASPTDWQQIGQTGTKTAASTSSALMRSMIAGTLVARNSVGSSR